MVGMFSQIKMTVTKLFSQRYYLAIFFFMPLDGLALEPDGVILGSGLVLYPDFTVQIKNDDNAYLQPDSTREEVTLTTYTPGIGLAGDFGQYRLTADYKMKKGIYNSTYDDNYLDHFLNAGLLIDSGRRNEINLNAKFKAGHDDRGSGTVEGAAALGVKYPDEYNELSLGSAYTYGADKAFANITGSLSSYQRKYKNNFEAGTRDRDHSKLSAGLSSKFAISSDSGVLVDLSVTDIAYDNKSSISDDREGSIIRLLAGAGWDITGKSSGAIKAGLIRRGFTNDEIEDDLRFSWEANLLWEPKDYYRFSFVTAQAANETSGPGFYIDSSLTKLSLDYDISVFYSLNASLSSTVDDYYQESGGRKDTTARLNIAGSYTPADELLLGLAYEHANRDSSETGLDYSRNVVTLTFVLAM